MSLAHGCYSKPALVYIAMQHYVHPQQNEIDEEDMKMFGPLKKIARALQIPTVQEREMNYLNGAKDRYDLEFRMRHVDSGAFRRGF